ncbi:MAG TPA: T9SS type A sorting domain-containing protein, partial [Chitinophagaceae bacterium]|nr:T9SS type A sorting domain-containing protein [Chitinophagaceae bacterium]
VGNSSTDSLKVIPVAEGGTIYITANNNYCTSDFQALDVIVIPLPSQPEYISGNNIVCQISSQSYFIDPVNYASDFTWTIPAGWSGSSTSNRIAVLTGTNGGTISVTANNQCGSSSPQTIVINVLDTVPHLLASIIGNNSVCINSTQSYSVSAVPAATNYLWTLPSGWVGNSTTNTITTTVGAHSGEISVIAKNDCSQSNAQTFSVAINALPQPGAITGTSSVYNGQTVNYSINQVVGATGYTWALSGGGTIISGQNTNSIIVRWQTQGNYVLSVKASDNCGTSSDQTLAVAVSIATGVNNPGYSFEIKLLPNPSLGEFYLKAKGVQNKLIRVDITNTIGQKVYRSGPITGANDYTQLINMDKMPQGIYAIKIMIDDKVYVRSIVISN